MKTFLAALIDVFSGPAPAAGITLSADDALDTSRINPASGLPMAGSLDVAGNPFGTSSHDSWCGGASWSSGDSWSSHGSSGGWSGGGSMFD